MTDKRNFDCRLRRGEKIFGWIFLPVYSVGAVFILSFIYWQLSIRGIELSLIQQNLMLEVPALIIVLLGMRRFLRASFDGLMDNLGGTFKSILGGYALNYVLAMLVTYITVFAVGGLPEDNPNQAAVAQLVTENFSKMLAMTVFIAPVVEECLFRGVVFGTIRQKNRVLAWAVTIVLFAFYHLWQSFVFEYEPILWLNLLDYVPAGVALCRCYEKSGNIWGPIGLHMLNNAIAMWAQTMLA